MRYFIINLILQGNLYLNLILFDHIIDDYYQVYFNRTNSLVPVSDNILPTNLACDDNESILIEITGRPTLKSIIISKASIVIH